MRVVAVLLIAVMFTSAAFADTPTNRAIGWENGLSLRGMATETIGVQGIFDLTMQSPANSNLDTDLDFFISGIAFTPVIEATRGNLNMFAGFELYIDGSSVQNQDSNTDFSIIFGIEPEIFLIDTVSISSKIGVDLYFEGDNRGQKDTGSFNIYTFGSLMGGTAVNWYF